MTKPIDERWVAQADGYVGCDRSEEHGMPPGSYAPVICRMDDAGRAKLAAAAPEMARALLAIEWEGNIQDEAGCPECGALVRTTMRPGKVHLDDCSIDAALRKAGVR